MLTAKADPVATIDDLIRKARAFKGLTRRAAPKARAAVELSLRSQLSSGFGPNGVAWQPTVEGKRALPNAADRLTVKLVGLTIIAAVPFPYGIHQKGVPGWLPTRQTIPTQLTPQIAAALRAAFEREFEAIANG